MALPQNRSLMKQYFGALMVVGLLGYGASFLNQGESTNKPQDRDVANTTIVGGQNTYSGVTYNGSNDPYGVPQGTRTPPITREGMDRMLPTDKNILLETMRQYDQNIGRHCTENNGGDLQKSCGNIDVSNGDKNFHPEKLDPSMPTSKYGAIPRSSKATVWTYCDTEPGSATQGKYITEITYKDENGKDRVFRNPYSNEARCLTSPGREEDARTNIPPITKPRGYISTWHVVSNNYDYAGAHMPFTVWINHADKGYAYHAGTEATPVDGWPASAGCFRMNTHCALGLFNLVRRVGSNNVSFSWQGYKPECSRPAGVANPLAQNISHTESLRQRRQSETRLAQWFRETFGRPAPRRQVDQPVYDPREVLVPARDQ